MPTDLGLLGVIANASAGTTTVITNATGAIIPAGTFIYITGCWDSINTATAPTITCSTVGGATATANHAASPGSGATTTAGAGIWHQCFRVVTTADIAVGATIATITSNQSAVKRTAVAIGWSGITATLRGTVQSATSTGGSPSVASTGTALVAGDLVIGSASFENNAQMTGDADTLNGTWSAIEGTFTTGGSGATNVGSGVQEKIVTATGVQTYNPTGGGADTVACILSLVPAVVTDFTGSASLTGSGSLGTTGTLQVVGATATLSGSGSLSTTQTVAAPTTATLSGDGTLAAVGAPGTVDIITSITSQLFIGGVPVGSPVTHTLSQISSNVYAEFTVPGLTLAQLQSGTLTVRHIVTRANSTTPATVYVDSVELLADYQTVTPPGVSAFTGTATLSGDGSLTTIQVPRPAVIATFSGDGSLTTLQVPRPAVSANLSGAGTLSTTQALAPAGIATLSGAGTLSTAQIVRTAVTAALSGDGTLSATGTASAGAAGVATLSGDGTLTTTQAPRPTGIVALSGVGTLSVVPLVTAIGTATLSGAGTLTTVQVPRPTVLVSLSGSGTLTTLQVPRPAVSAALSGDGTLSTTQRVTVVGVATLSGSGTLFAVGITAGQVAFVGSGTLTTTQVVVVTATATLSGSGTLTTVQVVRPTGIAILSGNGTLTTVALPRITGAATLTGTGVLATVVLLTVARAVAFSGTGVLSAVGLPYEQVEFGWVSGLPFR